MWCGHRVVFERCRRHEGDRARAWGTRRFRLDGFERLHSDAKARDAVFETRELFADAHAKARKLGDRAFGGRFGRFSLRELAPGGNVQRPAQRSASCGCLTISTRSLRRTTAGRDLDARRAPARREFRQRFDQAVA